MDEQIKIQSTEEFKTAINSILQKEGFIDYKLQIANGSSSGDGYLGVITAVKVEGKTAKENKSLNLIVKSAPNDVKFRAVAPIEVAFRNEIFMYTTVFPLFQKFEEERNTQNLLAYTAKCFITSSTSGGELLMLDNLKECQYFSWNRKVPMDGNHLEIVLKQYGRYHALSFAFKDQRPEIFATLSNQLCDIYVEYAEKSGFLSIIKHHCEKLKKNLTINQQDIIWRLDKFTNNLLNIMAKATVNPDKYSVLLHGDNWCSNLMFQYLDSSHPTVPTNVSFLDWQISRLGAPTIDLAYFFYTAAGKLALDNFEHYLQIYYDSLSSHMHQLGSESSRLYPFLVFREQWKKYSTYGLGLAIMVLHIMLTNTSETVNLKVAAESGMNFGEALTHDIAEEGLYLERAQAVILHFINNNFI